MNARKFSDLVIAGWTGRNQAAVEEHIHELAALGVAAPKETPMFYRVSASLLTLEPEIQVMGHDSSGEVEFVLLHVDGELRVGLGSDHTDRKAEVQGVTLAKQLCPKPIALETWALAEVESHWDELILRSWATLDGQRALYQQGNVSAMRHPRELLQLYHERTGRGFGPGMTMFGGTLAAIGGVRWADVFEMELEDPVRGRRISHRYEIRALPVEG